MLGLLALDGATVTTDAMGCEKEIAHSTVEQGVDYVLALKDNHATLHNAVTTTALRDVRCDDYRSMYTDHGRIETRHYWLTPDIECLGVKGSWAGIAGVGTVESQVELAMGCLVSGVIFWPHCRVMRRVLRRR